MFERALLRFLPVLQVFLPRRQQVVGRLQVFEPILQRFAVGP